MTIRKPASRTVVAAAAWSWPTTSGMLADAAGFGPVETSTRTREPRVRLVPPAGDWATMIPARWLAVT
jgi:hypothetical protein